MQDPLPVFLLWRCAAQKRESGICPMARLHLARSPCSGNDFSGCSVIKRKCIKAASGLRMRYGKYVKLEKNDETEKGGRIQSGDVRALTLRNTMTYFRDRRNAIIPCMRTDPCEEMFAKVQIQREPPFQGDSRRRGGLQLAFVFDYRYGIVVQRNDRFTQMRCVPRLASSLQSNPFHFPSQY